MLPVADALPTRSVAGVNYALIAANIVVFALQVLSFAGSSGENLDSAAGPALALVPAEFVAHPLANIPMLFGHMFLHGSLSHIAGNMLFLWIFGDNVEDALGHFRYLLFYFACGLTAAFAQIALDPHSTVPMLGASGAISGVLGAYALLYPRSPIGIVNPIPLFWFFWGFLLWLPAWFVILEWFALNVWNAFHPTRGAGGVAFMAHVGGFVCGLLLEPLMRSRERVPYDAWNSFLGPRLRTGR
jgi:membrane associated rhomboid family serine protease